MPDSVVPGDQGRSNPDGASLGSFASRLLVALVVVAIAAALSQLTDVLVVLFGAMLVAIGLRAGARQEVRLSGTVQSLRDRNLAAATAWSAPGVTDVENVIEIV